MLPLFQTVTDLSGGAATLRQRAYGVIETADERLVGIHLRPWPKLVTVAEAWWGQRRRHERLAGNHCWLYYNQPLTSPNYLAAVYVVSNRDTTLATFHGALVVLDEIARLKRTDAIVCEIRNSRISDRLLRRWGWAQHLADSGRRHFIKRFYGTYPRALLPTTPLARLV